MCDEKIINCLWDCMSEEILENVTDFDSDNKASIVFRQSFQSYLVKACFQKKNTQCGYLKNELTSFSQ